MPTRTPTTSTSSKEEAAKKRTATPLATQKTLTPTSALSTIELQQMAADPRTARPSEVLAIQRRFGNQAVTQLIQAKLTVGAAHDAYEQEADRVAAQVMSVPDHASTVQRLAEDEEEIQAKPLAAAITPLVQRASEDEELQAKSIQRDTAPEEEEIQAKPLAATITPLVQRLAEDEEELQAKFVQREGLTEDEELQAKFIQRTNAPEEEEIQAKPLAATITPLVQRAAEDEELQAKFIQRTNAPEEEEIQAKPLAATITPLVQRLAEDEEKLQGRFIQREGLPEDEELQAKFIQRDTAPEEEELQAKSVAEGGAFSPGADFEGHLNAVRGGGTPLPDSVREFMEPRFGADFSGVRLHTDAGSAELNREVSAQAFTRGQDIYLGEGHTDIQSGAGKQLLAHELTHTLQQGATPAVPPHVQRQFQFIQPDGSKTKVSSLTVLKNWLGRFALNLNEPPDRRLRVSAMLDSPTPYAFSWHLADREGIDELKTTLDNVPYFAGAQYALPWVEEWGYTFFEEMHDEAPGVFVSEQRVKYVLEKYKAGAPAFDVLAAAAGQTAFQSGAAKDQERFQWMCEHLSVEMLSEQLTKENLSLLIALQTNLKLAPTPPLLAVIKPCGADDQLRGLLYEFLKNGLTLPSLERLTLLKPYASQLIGHPEVLLRADQAAREEPGELSKYAPFSFDRVGYAAAQKYAGQQATEYQAEQTKALKEKTLSDQEEALSEKEEDATKLLSSKHRRGLEQSPETTKHKEAERALKVKQRELAEGEFAKIEERRLKREGEITQETETKKSKTLETYRDYLNDSQINHHPLAIKALEFSQFDFAFARKLVVAIRQATLIGDLLNSPHVLNKTEVGRCLDQLTPTALANILGLITQSELKIYTATLKRLAVLVKLHEAGATGTVLKQLVTALEDFEPYWAVESATAFARLVQTHHYSLLDIRKCLNASPTEIGTGSERAILVESIASHAESAEALRKFLQLARRVEWDGEKIKGVLAGQGAGLNATTLKGRIYAGKLAGLETSSALRDWLNALDVLVEDGWALIERGTEQDLGVGNSGSRTVETPCTVKRADTSAVLVSFVIHKHPGATVSTHNPYGSKKHLKPNRYSTTERLPYNVSLGKAIHKALGGGE